LKPGATRSVQTKVTPKQLLKRIAFEQVIYKKPAEDLGWQIAFCQNSLSPSHELGFAGGLRHLPRR
jgi:hypothetical protein